MEGAVTIEMKGIADSFPFVKKGIQRCLNFHIKFGKPDVRTPQTCYQAKRQNGQP